MLNYGLLIKISHSNLVLSQIEQNPNFDELQILKKVL